MADVQDAAHSQSASAQAADEASRDKGEPSLTSTLTILQRTQLIQLLAACTATQRDTLADAFSADAALPADAKSGLSAKPSLQSQQDLNPDVDPATANVKQFEEQRKLLQAREDELKRPEVRKLRDDALRWFDEWRTEMIQRVGEVVKLRKEAKKHLGDDAVKTMTPQRSDPEEQSIDPEHAEAQSEAEEKAHVDEQLRKLYAPVKTPLADLTKEKRVLILHSMLLILLSLERYSAPSRVLLLHLCTSLNIPLQVLDEDEAKTSTGLIEGAKQLSAKDEADKAAQENQSSRRWKVGLATAAGAAIIGVTGGLAAPLVAAGVGSVMGGLGLGATAAAGYLGSLAGSTVLVGGLFGAYGGRMTGQMMDNYAKEVSDFAFLPVHDEHAADAQKQHEQQGSQSGRPSLTRHESQQKDEAAGKQNPASRRLRVTVGISGWLTTEDEVVRPWKVLGESSEAFALRFELEALMNLGHAMGSMVSSAAWGYAKKTVISQTILASLMSAVAWPVGLMKVARVVDNPFSVAKARADKAGTVLADALINRAQGERPVSLVGYSLGARVVYSCLKTLADRKAFGLVDSAVLIGAAVPSTELDWRSMRTVTSGRLVNVFSENDYVLGFLYRTSSVQYGVAGLQKIDGVAGVENVNVSDTISGHLRYQFLVGSILQQIGWEDLSDDGLKRERQALEDMERAQRQRTLKDKGKAAGMMVAGFERTGEQTADPEQRNSEKGPDSDAGAEDEARKMEQDVRDKTQLSMLQRGARYLSLSGSKQKLDTKDGKPQGETSEANKTSGAAGSGDNGQASAASSSYLPDMSKVSMPKVSMPSMPKVAAPSWPSWGDKDKGGQAKRD